RAELSPEILGERADRAERTGRLRHRLIVHEAHGASASVRKLLLELDENGNEAQGIQEARRPEETGLDGQLLARPLHREVRSVDGLDDEPDDRLLVHSSSVLPSQGRVAKACKRGTRWAAFGRCQ